MSTRRCDTPMTDSNGIESHTRMADAKESDSEHIPPPQTTATTQPGSRYSHIVAQDHAALHLGDVYHVHHPRPIEIKPLGPCLSSAPLIDPSDFIGRRSEIEAIHAILRPNGTPHSQCRAVLGGIGGVGKSQLALAYARYCQQSFTTILWLNATSEATLFTSLRSIVKAFIDAADLEKFDNTQMLARAHQWLSHSQNTQWLLMFDNYDNPDEFNLDHFCPNIGHGSVLITTRLPDSVVGQKVRVQPLKDIEDGLDILQARSRREDVRNDTGACSLAKRLAGLPLALVTAGAYLKTSPISFQQYLNAYENDWQVSSKPVSLLEYPDRTLYTTWNLTYARFKDENPDAAKMLRLLAYFDHQEIWYELLRAGCSSTAPAWLNKTLGEPTTFGDMMSTLVDFGLLELQETTRSYSMHSCVHDWTLNELNIDVDPQLYWFALDCVSGCIDANDLRDLDQIKYHRITRHGVRLTRHCFESCLQPANRTFGQIQMAICMGEMLSDQDQLSAAESLYTRLLAGMKQSNLYDDNKSAIMNNLGKICAKVGDFDQAEVYFEEALLEYKKPQEHNDQNHSGVDVHLCMNLAGIYLERGEFEKAKQMSLVIKEMAEADYDPRNYFFVSVLHNFAVFEKRHRRLESAEQYCLSARSEMKDIDPDNRFLFDNYKIMGDIRYQQRRYLESERSYRHALAGYQRILRPDHPRILGVNEMLDYVRDAMLEGENGKKQMAEQKKDSGRRKEQRILVEDPRRSRMRKRDRVWRWLTD